MGEASLSCVPGSADLIRAFDEHAGDDRNVEFIERAFDGACRCSASPNDPAVIGKGVAAGADGRIKPPDPGDPAEQAPAPRRSLSCRQLDRQWSPPGQVRRMLMPLSLR